MRSTALFRLPVRLGAVALTFASLATWAGTDAAADTSSEGTFLSDIGSARADQGLPSYAVSSDLTATARRWAQHMATTRTLAHNPSITSDVCCWSDLGENVGVGSSASSIHRAFMRSSEHRDNILSTRYTQVGVGTARDSSGRLYVDEIFRRPNGSAPAPAPTPSPSPTQQVRTAPPRASRGVVRAPRVAPAPDPTALLRARLTAIWLRIAPQARHADPLEHLLLYTTVMRSATR